MPKTPRTGPEMYTRLGKRKVDAGHHGPIVDRRLANEQTQEEAVGRAMERGMDQQTAEALYGGLPNKTPR